MNALLDKDWITVPAIDRELKRYVLLAYLQRVEERFRQHRLFPHVEDLGAHLQRLAALQQGMDAMRDAIPKDLIGADALVGQLKYAAADPDPEALRVITDVIEFALPELRIAIERGQDLLSAIAEQVHFEPVGVLPLDVREGYMMVRQEDEVRVYAYAMPVYRETVEVPRYHSVRTQYLTSYTWGITWRYEHIKADLARARRELPNPATFVLETQLPLPCVETCLPIARRLLWQQVTGLAA